MPASVQGAQAVGRAMLVLRTVARARTNGVALAQVVKETKLNKPTAHRLLLALINEGMIEQDPTSLRYLVGQECYALGVIANERFGYGRAAGDAVARLAQFSGDSAFFSIRSDVLAVCVLREDGDYPLKTHILQPGTRHPLGVGAGSLAMLAAMEEAEVERCMQINAELLLSRYPKYTRALLDAEVKITRERGYSVNQGLVLTGSWGIGAAVRSSNGEVVGAFSIAAVAEHLPAPRQEKLAPFLIKEAKQLESHLRQLETIRPESIRKNEF